MTLNGGMNAKEPGASMQIGKALGGLLVLVTLWCVVFVALGFAAAAAWWLLNAGWAVIYG